MKRVATKKLSCRYELTMINITSGAWGTINMLKHITSD